MRPTETNPAPDIQLNLNVRGLQPSATLAINERSDRLRRQGRRIFKLGLGQSPFPVPEPVVEALRRHAPEKDYLPVRGLPALRQMVPDDADLALVEPFLAPLVTLAGFDLGQGRLTSFSAFRFLYERLIGAEARPWLPSAFCAAAALPHLHPELRRKLLQSISEAAATASGWSNRQPAFFPHWVEKVDNGSAALPH